MGTQKKVGFTTNSNIEGDSLIINNGLTASTQYTFNGLTASTFSLPTVDGTVGQAIITDGNGNLSFGSVVSNSTSGTSGISGNDGSNTARWIYISGKPNPVDQQISTDNDVLSLVTKIYVSTVNEIGVNYYDWLMILKNQMVDRTFYIQLTKVGDSNIFGNFIMNDCTVVTSTILQLDVTVLASKGSLETDKVYSFSYIRDGRDGTDGVNGTNGVNGLNGSSGTSGLNGSSGSSGSSGTSGVDGKDGTFFGSSGTSGTSGVDGNFYGSSGSSGTSGSSGSSGTSGAKGYTGNTGATGSNGSSGTSGTSGVNGINGSSGINGATGATGSGLGIQTPLTLTDGTTITWNYTQGFNAYVSLNGNRTLNITGVTAGDYGTIIFHQGTTASTISTWPTNSLFVDDTFTFTNTINSKDLYGFYYDGTDFYWSYNLNYK